MFEVKLHGEISLKGSDSNDGCVVRILGAPDEDLEPGQVLICTEEASITVSRTELQRALRAFERPARD